MDKDKPPSSLEEQGNTFPENTGKFISDLTVSHP